MKSELSHNFLLLLFQVVQYSELEQLYGDEANASVGSQIEYDSLDTVVLFFANGKVLNHNKFNLLISVLNFDNTYQSNFDFQKKIF